MKLLSAFEKWKEIKQYLTVLPTTILSDMNMATCPLRQNTL